MEHITKTNIISLIFAVACLALYFFFPIEGLKFEIFVGAMCFLLVLPILYTKIILHKSYGDIGFMSLTIEMRDVFFIASSIILGGLLSFVVVSFGWGVQAYLSVLSNIILFHFGAFALYELIFASMALFLFTFFAWGFVYSIECKNKIYTYIASFIVFVILLVDFYDSIWVILPLLVPTFFVPQIRNKKNIIYLFIAIFVIGLVLDTLIVKSFS